MCTKSLQVCPALYDPMNCSLPSSSVRGIFQARILDWATISFSRGYSGPRDLTLSLTTPPLALAGRFFSTHATWEAPVEKHR